MPSATSGRGTRFTAGMLRSRISTPRALRIAARPLLAAVTAGAALVAATAMPAAAATPQAALSATLSRQMRAAGSSSGALVVDLGTGRTLYSSRARTRRIPASVEKLYTTSSVLLRFGSSGRLRTRVFGAGRLEARGVWRGNLYLRGGGDPTFGSTATARAYYGSRAAVGTLAQDVVDAGVRRITGRVLGDGTLLYNGIASRAYAAARLAAALRSRGVRIGSGTSVGAVPSGAELLAGVTSPTISALIRMTNVPSNNYLADTLLRALGTGSRGIGTYARGAAAVRARLAPFGLRPQVADGSGLSRANRTSPAEVVRLLTRMSGNATFRNSLAVVGRSGTLAARMRGTRAAGRCRGKTGTLSNVSNLAGYCRARNGDTLAFAILMNGVWPAGAHTLQDRMAVAIARYNGPSRSSRRPSPPPPRSPSPPSPPGGGAPG